VLERLKGILARSGRSTGADAQICKLCQLDSSVLTGSSYHSQINLNSCRNPQRISIPCRVPFVEQTTIDEPGSNDASDCDYDTKTEQKCYG
jgi:hypothetical protein